MTTLPDVIELTAEEEAGRLWDAARTAIGQLRDGDVVRYPRIYIVRDGTPIAFSPGGASSGSR